MEEHNDLMLFLDLDVHTTMHHLDCSRESVAAITIFFNMASTINYYLVYHLKRYTQPTLQKSKLETKI